MSSSDLDQRTLEVPQEEDIRRLKKVFPVEAVKENRQIIGSDTSICGIKKNLWRKGPEESTRQQSHLSDALGQNIGKNPSVGKEGHILARDLQEGIEPNHSDVSSNVARELDVSYGADGGESHFLPAAQEPAVEELIETAAEPPPGPEFQVPQNHVQPNDEVLFRLPTPPPSSSSSSEASKSDDESDMTPMPQPAAFQEMEVDDLASGGRYMDQLASQPKEHMEDLTIQGKIYVGETEYLHESTLDEMNGRIRGREFVEVPETKATETEFVANSTALQDKTRADSESEEDVPLIALKTVYSKKKRRRRSREKSNMQDVSEVLKASAVQPTTDLRKDIAPVSGQHGIVSDRRNEVNSRNRRAIMDSPDQDPLVHSEIDDGLAGLHRSAQQNKRRRINSTDSEEQNLKNPTNGTNSSATEMSVRQGTPLFSTERKSSLDALQDTPESPSRAHGFKKQSATGSFLTNTPVGDDADAVDDVVCQICMAGDSHDEDQIVLCDACNHGFHQFCYPVPTEIIGSDEPFFCDSCTNRSKSGSPLAALEKSCIYCFKSGGALRNSDLGWCHPLCLAFSNRISAEACSFCSRNRAVKCDMCSEGIHPYCAIAAGWTIVHSHSSSDSKIFCHRHSSHVKESYESARVIQIGNKNRSEFQARPKKLHKKAISKAAGNDDDRKAAEGEAKNERLKRRRDVLSRYVLEEADIASDQDIEGDEGEEDEIRRIEEEEGYSQDSFINDNAHLTQHYSQDELGQIDPDAADSGFDNSHRALDAQRELENQFKTPNFNRRMMRRAEENMSVPSSERGLGQMHFIRSVLEHHRQGGDCEEIEQYYKQLEQEGSSSSPAASVAGATGNHLDQQW